MGASVLRATAFERAGCGDVIGFLVNAALFGHQKARDGLFEAGMRNPVNRPGFHRQVAALDLVKALGASLDR